MRSFLIAAALGLGLLSAGPATSTATAAPLNVAAASTDLSGGIELVQYRPGYGRPHYAPRPHWRPAPRYYGPPRHYGPPRYYGGHRPWRQHGPYGRR
ncbi:MAG: hypothetical protein JWR10_2994 [Rubritepida sp.]|nr:hypothetical protein [Rubritepida sp.]